VEDSKFELPGMKLFCHLERCLDESGCATSRTLAALANIKIEMAERSVRS
jgi:hypothetical protein